MPIDDHAGIRIVRVEETLERSVHTCHRRVGEGSLAVAGRVPRGEEHGVAFTQRHLESLGEREHELRAGLRAACLHEAQMASGYADFEREIELTAVAAGPPVAYELPDDETLHAPNVRAARAARHYLLGSAPVTRRVIAARQASSQSRLIRQLPSLRKELPWTT